MRSSTLRFVLGATAIAVGLVGAAVGASQAFATGSGNCGSTGHAVPMTGGGWQLVCPGNCAAPPANQICKQQAPYIPLDGWMVTQCACYLSDGTTYAGIQMGDEPCAEWLRRRTVEGVTEWNLKCFKIGCAVDCDAIQSGDPDPVKWDCKCP